MSHLVDRNAVKRVTLGPCDSDACPVPVHWVDLSLRYSYIDKMALFDVSQQGAEALARFRFLKRVKAWNLADEAGKPLGITHRVIGELDEKTAGAIWKAIDELDDADEEPDLPNA